METRPVRSIQQQLVNAIPARIDDVTPWAGYDAKAALNGGSSVLNNGWWRFATINVFFFDKNESQDPPNSSARNAKIRALRKAKRGLLFHQETHGKKKKVFRLWMEISAPACWPKPSKSTDHMFPVGICKHAFLLVFNPFVLHLVPASPACHLTSWSGAPTKLGCCEPWWFYHQLASTHTQSINDSHLTQGTCLLGVELRGNTYFHHLAQLRLQAVGLHSSYDAPPQKKNY